MGRLAFFTRKEGSAGSCFKGLPFPHSTPSGTLARICRDVSPTPGRRHITGGYIGNAMAVGKGRVLPGDAVPAAHQSSAIRTDRITASGYMVQDAGSGRQTVCTQRLQGITGQSRSIHRDAANRER